MELFHFMLIIGFIGFSDAQSCLNENEIRLQGGIDYRQGRLEVCRKGIWHTVCNQNFGQNDAAIVCRELGFSDKGATRLTSGFLRSSNNKQWTANIVCLGNEERLTDCPTLGLSNPRFCNSNTNVGVKCESPQLGELRILGGNSTFSGRLEVFKGSWGTVCDDYWSRNDAKVACRQLGFSTTGARAVRTGYRKRDVNDETPIFLDNLICDGSESRLIDCRQSKRGLNNCNHLEDAGIVCTSKRSTTFIELLEELLEN